MSKATLADELLSVVNQRIDEMARQFPGIGLIDGLASLYSDSWTAIKQLSGTSAQWPWLAEYSVFYVVKKRIEEVLETKLVPKKDTKSIYVFVDRTNDPVFMLCHNRFLEKNRGAALRIQPDISLYKNHRLLFTMDVKVGVIDSKGMMRTLDKLIKTAKYYRSKVYLVCVTKDLDFGVTEGVEKKVEEFYEAGGVVIGPQGGSLERRMSRMHCLLATLEDGLVTVSKLARG